MFRVVSVCLGTPPETICFEYRDKDKNFHRIGPITPKDFYIKHVKPLYNLRDKVLPLTFSVGPHYIFSLPAIKLIVGVFTVFSDMPCKWSQAPESLWEVVQCGIPGEYGGRPPNAVQQSTHRHFEKSCCWFHQRGRGKVWAGSCYMDADLFFILLYLQYISTNIWSYPTRDVTVHQESIHCRCGFIRYSYLMNQYWL